MSINQNVSKLVFLFNLRYVIQFTDNDLVFLFVIDFSYFTALVNLVAMAYAYLPCYFPIPYGCWCGITIPFPAQNDPVDEYDALCKSHDFCYEDGIAAVNFKSNFQVHETLRNVHLYLIFDYVNKICHVINLHVFRDVTF